MALLRAQQKHKYREKQKGSFARLVIFLILLVAITAVPLLLLRAQSRRFDDTVADLDDGEDEGTGTGEEAGHALLPAAEEPPDSDFSLDEELAKIDAQLEEIRQRRQEMEEAPYLPKISSVVDGNGAEEVDEEALPKELVIPDIDKPKDLHNAWELLINFATRTLEECGQGCKTCAVSVGTANIKLDTELMKSGEMPTISALQQGNETERKVESIAREINRCAVQAAAAAARTKAFGIVPKPIGEAALKRRKRHEDHREAETRFRNSMHEMDEAEEAARQQERLRQELQAKMEEAEQEFKELHELANPIWYDLETLREKALEVCTVKAQQIATQRHHKQAQELTSSAAAKEMEALTRACIKDFVASREKVKHEAESFQVTASHRKDKDLKEDAKAVKHNKRDEFRLAGVEEVAQLQIDRLKKDAMHMTYQDLKKGGMAFFSGNGEQRPDQKGPGKGKKGSMKPRQPTDSK